MIGSRNLIQGPRRFTEAELDAIETAVEKTGPLVEVDAFLNLIDWLGNASIDPFEAVLRFALCSAEVATLLRADCGLDRLCRLHEHIQGGLWVLERLVAVRLSRTARMVVRLAVILSDIGKPICAAKTRETIDQGHWNVKIAGRVLARLLECSASLGDLHLTAEELHDAVLVLIDHDVFGTALRGRFDFRVLARIRRALPEVLWDQCDAMLWAMYLADAGAHTCYAFYRDADTMTLEACVRSHHRHQLTNLFRVNPKQGLTLASRDHRRIIERLLPGLAGAMRDPSRRDPRAARPPVVETEIAGIQSAGLAQLRLRDGGVPLEELARTLGQVAPIPMIALVQVRMHRSRALSVLHDPGAGVERVSNWSEEVRTLIERTGWTPVNDEQGEILVILPLRNRRPERILACLLENDLNIGMQVDEVLTAPSDAGAAERRPACVIRAAGELRPQLLALALDLGEPRVTIMDFRGAGRTAIVALAWKG